MAMRPAYVLVATPLRTALWRVGPGGSIEVSRDAGRTWQPQRTNVTADLTAVSAPSETVCWAVGSGGVVLRTTDGEHWEKIASPAARDWTHVEARDALHASVADSAAGYITADGGRSWRALP